MVVYGRGFLLAQPTMFFLRFLDSSSVDSESRQKQAVNGEVKSPDR